MKRLEKYKIQTRKYTKQLKIIGNMDIKDRRIYMICFIYVYIQCVEEVPNFPSITEGNDERIK